MITISNLQRPGLLYDSSKLAILGNKITSSIRQRTRGRYIAKSTIEGRTMKIRVKVFDENTKKYIKTTRDEQEVLAGRISSFLNNEGISHNIRVN